MSTDLQSEANKIFMTDYSNGVLLIAPMGNLPSLNWVELETASLSIFEMLNQHPDAKVLVDMTFLDFCGSTLLGIIMRIWLKVSKQNGAMVVCLSNPQIARLLKVTQLDKVWKICPTREAAHVALLDSRTNVPGSS